MKMLPNLYYRTERNNYDLHNYDLLELLSILLVKYVIYEYTQLCRCNVTIIIFIMRISSPRIISLITTLEHFVRIYTCTCHYLREFHHMTLIMMMIMCTLHEHKNLMC